MIFAKGIASGFPFAGLAVRDKMFDGLALGTMGGTYGASPSSQICGIHSCICLQG